MAENESENSDWSYTDVDWKRIEGVLEAAQAAIDKAIATADQLLVDIEFTQIMLNEGLTE